MNCLFCSSEGPFSTIEHIVPESLGNNDVILEGHVCDNCQNYFGREVEHYVLSKTPIAMWRAIMGIRTKKNKLPKIDMSQPKKQKGKLPDKSNYHDNDLVIYSEPDGNISIECKSDEMKQRFVGSNKNQLHFTATPKVLCYVGRFLGKIGLELLCLYNPDDARKIDYDDIRNYARFGTTSDIWPIFHFSNGKLENLKSKKYHLDGSQSEQIFCYSYHLRRVDGVIAEKTKYILLHFITGLDNWIICLNDRCPHPIIQNYFPGHKLNLMWVNKDQLNM